jgi:hypothetical protein
MHVPTKKPNTRVLTFMMDHHIHSSSLSTKTQRPAEHDHHDHLYQQERDRESDLIKRFTRTDLKNLQNHTVKTRCGWNLAGRIVTESFKFDREESFPIKLGNGPTKLQLIQERFLNWGEFCN